MEGEENRERATRLLIRWVASEFDVCALRRDGSVEEMSEEKKEEEKVGEREKKLKARQTDRAKERDPTSPPRAPSSTPSSRTCSALRLQEDSLRLKTEPREERR